MNPPVRVDLHVGHALHVLNQLPDATAAGCVTSSPYFKRRAYGTDPAETGAGTLAAFLDDIEHVARALHRVCRPDALCFWNIGDTAAGSGGAGGDYRNGRFTERPRFRQGDDVTVPAGSWIGVPGLVRARLVAAGWLVRADIVWQKTTPRPEDVAYVRRPLEQSEVVFMLAKGRGYAYVPEAATYGAFETARHRLARELRRARLPHTGRDVDQLLDALAHAEARMERGNVWRIPTDRAKGGHPAPMPLLLAERCVRMIGAPGPIIDPYMGRGTTAFAAWRAGRSSIGADLYPATVQLARDWLATMGVPTGSIRVARPVRSVA